MRKGAKNLLVMILLCINIGGLTGCGNNTSSVAPEVGAAEEVEKELQSQVDEIYKQSGALGGDDGNQISDVLDENYQVVLDKLNKSFDHTYYSKMKDKLNSKLSGDSSENDFDTAYDEVFENVYVEFYKNYNKNSKDVIYLEGDAYNKAYNEIKEKYYSDLKADFIK